MTRPDPIPGPNPGPTPARLRARGVHLAYGARTVVDGVDLDVPDGRITAIVGANGSGKSTLLRGLARLQRPSRGVVELDGVDLYRRAPREVARVLGLLPQHPLAPEGITVESLVARGRHPHRGAFRRWDSTDADAVARALEQAGVTDLAARRVEALSGGQRQRVWIAMTLAQEPDLLLLDEPTTYLDLAHQIDLLDLLVQLNAERGTTVVMVLHELALAARYADHLVVLREGRVLRAGPPGEVLDAACLREAFGLEARVIEDTVSRTPVVVPVGRR